MFLLGCPGYPSLPSRSSMSLHSSPQPLTCLRLYFMVFFALLSLAGKRQAALVLGWMAAVCLLPRTELPIIFREYVSAPKNCLAPLLSWSSLPAQISPQSLL